MGMKAWLGWGCVLTGIGLAGCESPSPRPMFNPPPPSAMGKQTQAPAPNFPGTTSGQQFSTSTNGVSGANAFSTPPTAGTRTSNSMVPGGGMAPLTAGPNSAVQFSAPTPQIPNPQVPLSGVAPGMSPVSSTSRTTYPPAGMMTPPQALTTPPPALQTLPPSNSPVLPPMQRMPGIPASTGLSTQ
jgi:hypothetical protein